MNKTNLLEAWHTSTEIRYQTTSFLPLEDDNWTLRTVLAILGIELNCRTLNALFASALRPDYLSKRGWQDGTEYELIQLPLQ